MIPLAPYLRLRNAAAAIDSYVAAFGADEVLRLTGPDGRVGHAELSLGGATLMLADEHPELGLVGPQTLGGSSVALRLRVADVDATWARAVAAGATGQAAPADQFYGERSARLRDAWGHEWLLAQVLETLSPDELQRRFAQLCGYSAPA